MTAPHANTTPHRDLSGEQMADRLHDELLPLLAVLRQDLLEDTPRDRLLELVDRSIGVTRSLVNDAHPAVDYQALEDALDAIARPMCQQAGLRLSVDIDFDCRKLTEEQYGFIIGAVRELVANAAHHAQARGVLVHGATQPGGWRVSVIDDGRGIHPAQARARRDAGHLGLKRLRRELKALDGRLVLDSGTDGTRATMHLTAAPGITP